jgi:outer membrane protein
MIATLALTAALALTQAPQGRRIDVTEAVRLTLEHSPSLAGVALRAKASADQAKSVRGHMLPAIFVQDEAQHYSEAFQIKFDLGIPGVAAPSILGRAVNTNTFVAGAQQPLLGLLHLWQDWSALDDVALAANLTVKNVEEMLREAVQTGYLRYFEAKAAEEVAKASIEQLLEQHQVMEARVKAGAATSADLLRVEVATANARQQAITATTQQQVARSALLLAMGFTAEDTGVDFVQPEALENATPPAVTEVDAQHTAADKRVEVAKAKLEERAADHQATAKLFALLPEANLEAAYVNIQGQAFAPQDSFYVGIKASWTLWEWGASWYQREAAAKNAQAATKAREEQERQVKSEASARLAAVQSSVAAMEVARTAITSAEEAFRVMQALVKAGSATTTDLLDAQAALTQARLNLVRARYQQAVALVAFNRAVGS